MTDETTGLIERPATQDEMTVADVLGHVGKVRECMRQAMKVNEHFGVIPGTTGKPVLLQPGAQLLSLMFKFAPEYQITRREMEAGHLEYEVLCRLTHVPTNSFVGSGVGLCSTLEAKYRYRAGGLACPHCGQSAIIKGREEYGGGWICFRKKGGCGAKFLDGDFTQQAERVENPDLADSFNTVLKMAKKRAFVDAVLTATAASDIFTQDIEDAAAPIEPKPEPKAEPKLRAKPAGKAADPEDYKALVQYLKAGGCRDKQHGEANAVIAALGFQSTLSECYVTQGLCKQILEAFVQRTAAGESLEMIVGNALKAAGLRQPTELEKQGSELF